MIRADQAKLPPIVRDNLDEVESLCDANHVKELHLFGSALSDRFRSDSDLDFTVEFKPDAPRGGFSGPYFSLLSGLKQIFGRDVDLVEYHVVRNPYFREELDETRVLIYGS